MTAAPLRLSAGPGQEAGGLCARVVLDERDLAELEQNRTLEFRIGDRTFELYTRARPAATDYAVYLHAQHLDSLTTAGRVEFRRPWGRLTVEMTEVVR